MCNVLKVFNKFIILKSNFHKNITHVSRVKYLLAETEKEGSVLPGATVSSRNKSPG